jgi:hypothetical protein
VGHHPEGFEIQLSVSSLSIPGGRKSYKHQDFRTIERVKHVSQFSSGVCLIWYDFCEEK